LDPEHCLNNCAKCADYIQKGLCQRNAEGQIVLPNGNRINSRDCPGRNLKDRLDCWHKANPASNVSINLVGVIEPKGGYIITVKNEKLDDVRTASSEEEQELQILENLVATTQQKIDMAKKRVAAKTGKETPGNTKSKPQNNQKTVEIEVQPAERSTRPDPQYRYVTPIEDPALIKKIAQQTLDTSITISTRELLSVVPDIRRHIKDQLVTKRVATAALAVNEVEEVTVANLAADKLIVAKHMEELRVIDVKIHGIKVIATVDDGSQIISICQDIWEQIGLPLRSDKITVMESANKTRNETMGLLQDLKISIGGYDFYLQVQVVKDTPYEMLLGRPFFTLTQATHKHFDNRESCLTLFDPNTQDMITFPTRAREREQQKQSFH
jgi:hypothetical protein